MSKTDFQNGFALGLASGGVIVEQGANPELIDRISSLIGSAPQYEVLWSASLSGFTLNADIGVYVAPYTSELPAIEAGAYKFEINGEIVDGSISKPAEGATMISAYLQDIGLIGLVFGVLEGQVGSYTEITNIDIKILKTDEVIDYYVSLSEDNSNIGVTVPISYGFVEGAFNITFATNDGSVSWTEPNNPSFSVTEGYSNMLSFISSAYPSTELMNALKNNTPVTVTISQNDVTKVIADSYVAITLDSSCEYCWGNVGFLINNSFMGS